MHMRCAGHERAVQQPCIGIGADAVAADGHTYPTLSPLDDCGRVHSSALLVVALVT
jgi:hypothetical protein